MSLVDVLRGVRSLSRTDKLRLIRLLAEELVEADELLEAGAKYPVWSPYEAYDAAATLMKILEAEKSHG